MNVLFISHSPLFPVDSGVIRRNLHLLLEGARSSRVSLLVLGSGHDMDGFMERYGGMVREARAVDVRNTGWRRVLRVCLFIMTGWAWVRHWHTRRVQRAIDAMCAGLRPDIIHLTTPLLMLYRYPAGIRIVADAHNVEYDNLLRVSRESASPLRRLLFSAFAWRLRPEEAKTAAQVDRLFVVSERDRILFRSIAPHANIAVIPNGVDLEGFAPSAGARRKHTLLFVGMMNYHPNDDGIRFFLAEVFPRILAVMPDVHLTIVGGEPSAAVRAAASPHVTVTGLVPDVRPFLASAEVLIVPLRAGGGTRLKLLEAMASGIPAVSTTIGCEGLGVAHRQHLAIADGPEAFARAVIELLGDAGGRERMAARAREFVRDRYGWERIGEALRAEYRALAPAQEPSPTRASVYTPVTPDEEPA